MMNFEGIQDLGGASAQNETQAPEEKVVNLEEQKKKRQPFAYWNVGGRSFKMKQNNENAKQRNCRLFKYLRIYEKKELASPSGVCDQEERGSSPGGCVSLHCGTGRIDPQIRQER